MSFPSINRRRAIMIAFALLALGGAIGGWWFSLPTPLVHPSLGIPVAHAQIGEDTGCAECHLAAIPFTNCMDCHDAPATTVGNNIYLVHHQGTADCETCHAVAAYPNDARYVQIPSLTHGFCNTCHGMHHEPQ